MISYLRRCFECKDVLTLLSFQKVRKVKGRYLSLLQGRYIGFVKRIVRVHEEYMKWRRGQDSNPRADIPHRLSRLVYSRADVSCVYVVCETWHIS